MSFRLGIGSACSGLRFLAARTLRAAVRPVGVNRRKLACRPGRGRRQKEPGKRRVECLRLLTCAGKNRAKSGSDGLLVQQVDDFQRAARVLMYETASSYRRFRSCESQSASRTIRHTTRGRK